MFNDAKSNYTEGNSFSNAVPAPEMSERMKDLIKKFIEIESVLNNVMWNVSLERHEREEKFKEPECHKEYIMLIENLAYSILRISEKLNDELK